MAYGSLSWHHMSTIASKDFDTSTVCSAVYPGWQQQKQAGLIVPTRGVHRWPIDSHNKGSEMRKAFPCADAIVWCCCWHNIFCISLIHWGPIKITSIFRTFSTAVYLNCSYFIKILEQLVAMGLNYKKSAWFIMVWGQPTGSSDTTYPWRNIASLLLIDTW